VGLRLFIDKRVRVEDFFGKNQAPINSFSKGQNKTRMHPPRTTCKCIYFDEQGTPIAFNTSGSTFCDLRFFLQLQMEAVSKGNTKKDLAFSFAFVANEVGYNLVLFNSANDSFMGMSTTYPLSTPTIA